MKFRAFALFLLFSSPVPAVAQEIKMTHAVSDAQSWAASSPNMAFHSLPAAPITTWQWKFFRLGGIGTSIGYIESVRFPQRCMASPNDNKGAGIVLVPCNPRDTRQQWTAMNFAASGQRDGTYRFENVAVSNGGRDHGCISETGPNSPGNLPLKQDTCSRPGPDRLWKVHNPVIKGFEGNPTPW